jgi:hypothetical protein
VIVPGLKEKSTIDTDFEPEALARATVTEVGGGADGGVGGAALGGVPLESGAGGAGTAVDCPVPGAAAPAGEPVVVPCADVSSSAACAEMPTGVVSEPASTSARATRRNRLGRETRRTIRAMVRSQCAEGSTAAQPRPLRPGGASAGVPGCRRRRWLRISLSTRSNRGSCERSTCFIASATAGCTVAIRSCIAWATAR